MKRLSVVFWKITGVSKAKPLKRAGPAYSSQGQSGRIRRPQPTLLVVWAALYARGTSVSVRWRTVLIQVNSEEQTCAKQLSTYGEKFSVFALYGLGQYGYNLRG
jgi:hypothetical protein